MDLEEAISPLIVRAVADGVAEIGIYGGNIPAPGLTVLPYRQDRLVVVVPTRHPLRKHASVRLDAVLPYDLVGVQKGSSIDALVMVRQARLREDLRRLVQQGARAECEHVLRDLRRGALGDRRHFRLVQTECRRAGTRGRMAR